MASNSNRIGRTSVARSPAPAVPWWKEALENPWVRRVGVVVAGAALGASCPLLPPPFQIICKAAVNAFSLASGVSP